MAPYGPRGDLPLYQQMADTLLARIDRDVYTAGQRLPGVRRLAREFHVSLSTTLRALELLESRGRIEARPRSGHFVSPRRRPAVPSAPERTSRPRTVNGQDRVLELLRGTGSGTDIALASALPHPDCLPTRQVNRALVASARHRTADDARYDFPPGHLPLRRAIAGRMHAMGCAADPADIVVTSGCQSALGLALRAICAPGDAVAVESPTYYGLLQALEANNLRALEIPSHPETGLRLDALRTALGNWPVRACVLVPSFSNPTGSCMPASHREELLSLARAHAFTVIEDDVYADLAHDGVRLRPVSAFDDGATTIYCSSFSKTLAPDLRIGWAWTPRHAQRLCNLQFAQQLAASGVTQRALARLLGRRGIDRHLRQVRRDHGINLERAADTILRYFPAHTAVTQPRGGYVLWVRIPGIDGAVLQQRAAEVGVRIAHGALFATDGRYRDCIRLNCSGPWEARIVDALKMLGQIAASI